MHPLLARQLRRHLGKDIEPPESWRPFLDAVDGAYVQAEADARVTEHALDVMSRELTQRNRELRDQLAEKLETEAALTREKEEQAVLIRKLETAHNQLLQSEKLASIGQLAAGVAHEINNPIGYVNSNLTTLGGYIEQLLQLLDVYKNAETALPDDSPELRGIATAKESADLEFLKKDVLDLLKESSDGIARVRRIVQDLKDFSHSDQGQWMPVDLHRGLDSTLNVVNNEIKYKAMVVKEYGELPLVNCLPSQLNQVFMNLLVNAAHAIEAQGTITLRTGATGEEVWIEIEDTGCGIPEQIRTRIFDPFYTTKPVGKGTGLGLSISYGIIQKHGGRIDLESEVGKGSTFRIFLPIKPARSESLPHE
jgi:two-component system NtrC family sensor kinase